MRILVTGATGRVGSEVVKELLQRGVEVRALTRKPPEPGTFPRAVEIALGDLTDPVSVAVALKNVDKLFLLIAGVPDEIVQSLIAYSLAKKAGLQQVTYLSIFKADQFLEVPHFAAKYAVEEAIRAGGMPYTILRPAQLRQKGNPLRETANPMGWLAHDLRLMFEGFVERGFRNTEDQTARFAALLGLPPRTYKSYAEELASEWLQRVA
jgi:uncharacterized protein YbjT (DUF2867 family)